MGTYSVMKGTHYGPLLGRYRVITMMILNVGAVVYASADEHERDQIGALIMTPKWVS